MRKQRSPGASPRCLPAPVRCTGLGATAVLDLATTARTERSAAAIIAAVAADLDDDGVQRALGVTGKLGDPAARALALGALIPRLNPWPESQLDKRRAPARR